MQRLLGAAGSVEGPSKQSLDRMRKVLSSLKSFVGLDEAEEQRLDLREKIDNAITLLRPQLPSGVDVVASFGSTPKVFGRVAELNQVFMTLLWNAAAAVGERGSVRVRTYEAAGRAHIAFSDTGPGISEEMLPVVFEPALVATGARVEVGFGLFVSASIVRRHGGDIWVESTEGEGSTFTVALRVSKPGVT